MISIFKMKKPETRKATLLAHKARDSDLVLAASVGPHS